ncbi:MAG TPA: SRPBCC family protein [Nitrososphaerales archaeon]|nr:SRPBCC family protein [Nitrososphaerales archaeon]
MPHYQQLMTIAAPPETVWEILENPIYTMKLYPDFLAIKVEPEGRTAAGQMRISKARAGTKLFEIRTVVSEVVPCKRLVLKESKGGAFTDFKEVIELTREKSATRLSASFDFTVSQSYFEGMNVAALEGAARSNMISFLKNLRELAELKPLR